MASIEKPRVEFVGVCPFPDTFFRQDAAAVAPALLGHYLFRRTGEGETCGVIVETEAYLSRDDPACHAARGRTKRNDTMFGPAGRAYVYFIYGMHHCFNIVTGPEGAGEAVLVRAVEPVSGLELMRKRRGLSAAPTNLAGGPGRLCRAFAINKMLDGHDLRNPPLFLAVNPEVENYRPVRSTARIGLSAGRDMPLRFVVTGSKYLSRREKF